MTRRMLSFLLIFSPGLEVLWALPPCQVSIHWQQGQDSSATAHWILDFLTERPKSVRIGNSISSTTTLSTGGPQGCVLSPLLFTLLTHDCVAMHSSNHIIKFAEDTTVVGLISKNDESAYREEWRIKSTKLLGVHLADNLTWSLNTSSITKKAQQCLYFLRRLLKAHLPPPILTMFYRGTIESILSSCTTAWFGNCTVRLGPQVPTEDTEDR
ncbi:gastrula zinc finger protein XlCGF28.1-like [Silurus meridionalis]|nr:gastrula zinc finger protein XlCGF28.1-like [Silurus meridionalis]